MKKTGPRAANQWLIAGAILVIVLALFGITL